MSRQMRDMKSKLKTLLRKGKLMAPPDISGFKSFLSRLLQPTEVPADSSYYAPVSPTTLVDSIVLVGFHHVKGSQVEFKFPIEAAESDLLPYLALPDSAHNEDADCAYFLLEIGGQWRYGVACFRQMPNEHRSLDMHRNYVQKSLVVLSNVPFFGTITSRMEAITQAYFLQGLSDTKLLEEMYAVLNTSLGSCSVSDLYVGFSVRKLLHVLQERLLVLWKLVLLEGRIIVYSRTASKVSSAIMALLSLFPGQLCFASSVDAFKPYLTALKDYGLPLKLFNDQYLLSPLLTLPELEKLAVPSYLIGCTNQMIIEHHQSIPHAVLNLDTEDLTLSLSPQVNTALKFSKKEKSFMRGLVKIAEAGEVPSWRGQEKVEWQGSDDNIRAEFHNYLKGMLSNLSFLRLKGQGADRVYTFSDSESPESQEEEEVKEEALAVLEGRKMSEGDYESLSPTFYRTWKLKKLLKKYKRKFVYQWSNTNSFKVWTQTHSMGLAYRSEYASPISGVEVRYENGDRYLGDLYRGQRHGRGVLHEAQGGRYEGQWDCDKRHGQGTYTSKDTEYVYDGEWVSDQKSGHGTEISKSGRYSGSFLFGKYNGQGTFVDSEGNLYEGEWVLGVRQGMAHWQSSAGDSYTGEFKDNLFDGDGQMKYATGDIYSGQFKQSVREGVGQLFKASGEVFRGLFKNGLETGSGALIKQNGTVINGYFQDGQLERQSCEVCFPDGRVFRGQIDDQGKPHGKGIMEMPSGNFVPAYWRHGSQVEAQLQ